MTPVDWQFFGMWIAASLALTAEVILNYLILKDTYTIPDTSGTLGVAFMLGIIRFALLGLCGILFYCAWL